MSDSNAIPGHTPQFCAMRRMPDLAKSEITLPDAEIKPDYI
jgi:hypothetical protein